jgi:GH25 family lysozyme M1 (1,4-beta-N-acetylmuramidase)
MVHVKRGIDISAHQGSINLESIKHQIDFVIIRVGYGVSGTIDNRFERNVKLCEELDIPYGFYWYSYALNTEDASTEADHFISAITSYNPTMGCWFDMEDADGYKRKKGMPSEQMLQDMCYVFCEKVENAGFYAGIYASKSWFDNQLAGEKLARFDKWVAQWPTSFGRQKGLDVDPESRTDLSMWQFTSEGRLFGYSGNLDMNYAYHDFVNPRDNKSKETAPEGSTLDLVVRVLNNEFGDGEERKSKLNTRYNEVQAFINHIHSASVDVLAKEIINENKYGVDSVRKTVLGDRYDEVQKRVNSLIATPSVTIAKGMKVRFTGTKSYSGLNLAAWTHNDIFNVIEVSGNRIVIGKGSVVTAAVNAKDCEVIK